MAPSISFVAVLLALISSVVYFLNSNLDHFYVFNPPQLHDISSRAIAAHRNDTSAVVAQIVGELSQSSAADYVNLDEEWIFNNAGGTSIFQLPLDPED